MHDWEWQTLAMAIVLLVTVFYSSSPLHHGFPSTFWSARFAREISISIPAAIVYTYVIGVSDLLRSVKWVENYANFCMPLIIYIVFSCLILIFVNSSLNLAFCKLESKKSNVILLSVVTAAINIFMLFHIFGLQTLTTECKSQ